jgi:hypothetical protein
LLFSATNWVCKMRAQNDESNVKFKIPCEIQLLEKG